MDGFIWTFCLMLIKDIDAFRHDITSNNNLQPFM